MEQDIIYVKDLMVPLDEYVAVSTDTSLYEAVEALEDAMEQVDHKGYAYLHRAILVYDENKTTIGKISQLDIIKAIEPKYAEMGDLKRISSAGFSQDFLMKLMEQYSLCDKSFSDMCRKAAEIKVTQFMATPSEGEFVEEEASLCEGIHQLVIGHHQSLFVTQGKKIVGILRLTDVFKEVFQMMKQCYQ